MTAVGARARKIFQPRTGGPNSGPKGNLIACRRPSGRRVLSESPPAGACELPATQPPGLDETRAAKPRCVLVIVVQPNSSDVHRSATRQSESPRTWRGGFRESRATHLTYGIRVASTGKNRDLSRGGGVSRDSSQTESESRLTIRVKLLNHLHTQVGHPSRRHPSRRRCARQGSSI